MRTKFRKNSDPASALITYAALEGQGATAWVVAADDIIFKRLTNANARQQRMRTAADRARSTRGEKPVRHQAYDDQVAPSLCDALLAPLALLADAKHLIIVADGTLLKPAALPRLLTGLAGAIGDFAAYRRHALADLAL